MTKTRFIAQLSAGIAASLFAVAFAGPAFSQAQAPAPKPAAPAKPAAAPAKPAGAPAAQQGDASVTSTPWQKVCSDVPDEKDPSKPKRRACYTHTVLVVNNQPYVQIQLSGIEGTADRSLEIFVPQGFLLQPGMRMTFDGQAVALPYTICMATQQSGAICSSQTVVNAEFTNKMKTAKVVALELRNPQRDVRLPIGNADFGKVFDGPGMDVAVAQELQRKRMEAAQAAQQKDPEQQKKDQDTAAAIMKSWQGKQNGQ